MACWLALLICSGVIRRVWWTSPPRTAPTVLRVESDRKAAFDALADSASFWIRLPSSEPPDDGAVARGSGSGCRAGLGVAWAGEDVSPASFTGTRLALML